MAAQLIGPFSQVVTLRHLPLRGALRDDQLEVVTHGALLLEDNKIVAVDAFETLWPEAKRQKATVYEIAGASVALPGMIDAHTHSCFAGTRASDYALRNAGASYQEIARAGGGIWDTVQKTRQQTQHELALTTAARATRLLREGVTTLEIKSGYGLSVEDELKMLRAIRDAQRATASDCVPTCLAAHTKPHDFEGDHEHYLQWMGEVLLPMVKSESLATRVDAFVDEVAFLPAIAKNFLARAKAMGFDITLHADQFSTGGSGLAIELGAVSADHLEASSDGEIDALAKSDVVAVALPGASLGLGCAFAPARKLLDAGAVVAIASDWNPGSAPMGDLLMQGSILGAFQKLSNAEVLSALTFRAAHALRLHDRGMLAVGARADFMSFPVADYREITYWQGKLKPSIVWKNGKRVD